jgi:hypothetical protein
MYKALTLYTTIRIKPTPFIPQYVLNTQERRPRAGAERSGARTHNFAGVRV